MDKWRSRHKQRQFFEGWYFKHHCGGRVLALIPGLALDSNGDGHGFLQVIAGENASYLSFAKEEFCWRDGVIFLGPNRFSPAGVELHIDSPELTLTGRLDYGYRQALSRPIMGPFAYLPFMECYHEILSLNHCLRGRLCLNGTALDFDGGKGYIEKDWGHSFPGVYRWFQANDFGVRNVSVTAAIASIPRPRFTGCIAALLLHKKTYTFTSYQGVRILENREGFISLAQKNRRLEIAAGAASPLSLAAPRQGAMDRIIHEHAATRLNLRFFEDGRLVFAGESAAAGYESVSKEMS